MKRHYCHTIDLSRTQQWRYHSTLVLKIIGGKCFLSDFPLVTFFLFCACDCDCIAVCCHNLLASMENFKKPNYSAHVFNRNNGDERRIHKQLHFITFNVRIARYRCFIPFYFISFYSISHYLYRTLFTNSDHKSRGCFKIIRCRGLCFRYGAAFVYLQKFNRQ